MHVKKAKVVHVTPSKFIVAVTSGDVRGDLIATDSKGNVVGKVVDVFGPISAPYLLIKPQNTTVEEGTQLFLYRKAENKRDRE
jgi:rRNA processing protein Gar1